MKLWMVALLAAVSVIAALAPSEARAQIKDTVIGIDAGVGVLFGGMADQSGALVGGIVRYENRMQPALSLTGRLGYLRGLDKDVSGTMYARDVITVRGGAVYRLQATDDGVFLTGEVTFNYLSLRRDGVAEGDSESELGGGVGAGYRSGVFTLRGAIEYLDFSHTDTSMAGLLTVGWDFKGL